MVIKTLRKKLFYTQNYSIIHDTVIHEKVNRKKRIKFP